jgi:hypothetical protein
MNEINIAENLKVLYALLDKATQRGVFNMEETGTAIQVVQNIGGYVKRAEEAKKVIASMESVVKPKPKLKGAK